MAKGTVKAKAAAQEQENVSATAEKKKAPARKAAAKQTEKAVETAVETVSEKKAPAKKAPAKRKPKAPAAAVSIQFAGKDYTTEKLVEIAKDVWQYDLGRNAEEFKAVELYVKPEEAAVYYVINGDTTGSFQI